MVRCSGYEAWRHAELGSWFVRTLVYVFQRHAHHQHILDMLTEVRIALWHCCSYMAFAFYRWHTSILYSFHSCIRVSGLTGNAGHWPTTQNEDDKKWGQCRIAGSMIDEFTRVDNAGLNIDRQICKGWALQNWTILGEVCVMLVCMQCLGIELRFYILLDTE